MYENVFVDRSQIDTADVSGFRLMGERDGKKYLVPLDLNGKSTGKVLIVDKSEVQDVDSSLVK